MCIFDLWALVFHIFDFDKTQRLCSLQVRFLSDLVNCHVIAAPSMVAMFENFVSVAQEEDVPQVRKSLMINPFSVVLRISHLVTISNKKPKGCILLFVGGKEGVLLEIKPCTTHVQTMCIYHCNHPQLKSRSSLI